MTVKIIIDDGSSFIKLCQRIDGKPNVTAFASRVIDGATTTMDNFSDRAYETAGFKYSVTESAPDSIPTSNRAYQCGDANRVLINHALRSVHAPSVHILLTLPVSQFYLPDGSKNIDVIEQKKESALTQVLALDGTTLPKISQVNVMPEGVAAYNNIKHELQLANGRYLVADIGGTTTDLIVLDEDSNIVNFLSIQLGALNMMNSFKAACLAKLGINNLTDKQVYKGILTGVIIGEDVNLEAQVSINSFKTKINRYMNSLGDIETFDGVLYSGGGAHLFANDGSILKTNEPQFDNVLGAFDFWIGED